MLLSWIVENWIRNFKKNVYQMGRFLIAYWLFKMVCDVTILVEICDVKDGECVMQENQNIVFVALHFVFLRFKFWHSLYIYSLFAVLQEWWTTVAAYSWTFKLNTRYCSSQKMSSSEPWLFWDLYIENVLGYFCSNL